MIYSLDTKWCLRVFYKCHFASSLLTIGSGAPIWGWWTKGSPLRRGSVLYCLRPPLHKPTLLAASGVIPAHLSILPKSHIPWCNLQLIAHSQYRETLALPAFKNILKLYIQQTTRLIFLLRHIWTEMSLNNFNNERLIRSYSSFRSTSSNPQVIYVLMTHDWTEYLFQRNL